MAFSCNPYIQVVEVKSNQLVLNEQKELVFENDTLRIRYDFFSENGHIKFSVLNKLKKPLYINWKESAFITGTNSFSYWQDEYISNGYISGYAFDWNSYFSSFGAVIYSVAKRDEQISFLPPGTEMYQLEYIVKPGAFGSFNKGSREEIKDSKGKKTIGIKHRFNEEDAPLKFRNYLTFSTDADSKSTFVFDTHFWVSEVYKTKGQYVFKGEYAGHNSLPTLVNSRNHRLRIGSNRFILRDDEYTEAVPVANSRKSDASK
jgi:hypothetical protein